jgi:cholesterol transport system auxiliary component
MTRRLLPVALLALSLLSACSILPKSEPLDVYLLPAQNLPAQAPTVSWALRIDKPQTEQILDGTRLVVLPEPSRLNTYQGARWSERTPLLLRNRLLDGFRDDGRINALSSDEQNLASDLELVSSLRRFHSQYEDGQVLVKVQLDAQLVNVHDQSIVATKRFNITQASAGTDVAEVVQAFGLASDTLTQGLVQWVIEHGPQVLKVRQGR